MRKLGKIGLIAASMLLAGQALAEDGKMLMIKYGCIGCHTVDVKMVGPSYRDVSARYQNQADATEHLKQSIINGGVNQWGQIPMPPRGGRADLTDEDVDQLIAWILEL